MGYTAGKTELMIGLGMSSISDSWYAFAQNEKNVEDKQERVNEGELPVFRGHLLSDTDLTIRKHILDLMCNLETTLNDEFFAHPSEELLSGYLDNNGVAINLKKYLDFLTDKIEDLVSHIPQVKYYILPHHYF